MRVRPLPPCPLVGVICLGIALARPFAIQAAEDHTAEARTIQGKVEALLRAEMTERWYPRAVDRKGGFHQNFARDWSAQPDTSRAAVPQARLTWTAAAYAHFDHTRRDEFLGYARHGVDYLDRALRDREQGGFHWVVNLQGQPDLALGLEKHVYGTAFILYAASAVRAVGGERETQALQVARDAFRWLEDHAHDPRHGGYFEALTRDGRPIPAAPDGTPPAQQVDRLGVYHGYKTMNAHIHLLEALAEHVKVDPIPLVRDRLREVHGLVRDRITNDPGALNLYMTPDWRATPAHDSFGHDVETAYLLEESAAALGMPDDEATARVARRLVDHALDWGWDTEYGGFYDKGDVFAHAAYDRKKVWWTQAEGLNTLLRMHRRHGATTDRYWKAFVRQWAFIEQHQLDPVHGGWFGEVTREGQLIGDGQKANPWQANYHTGRALMNVATALAAMTR